MWRARRNSAASTDADPLALARARRRIDELEHRHRTHLEQARLLRDWVVRQQRFLDGVVTSLQAGIVAVNADGTVTTSNVAAEHLLGDGVLRVGRRVVDAEGTLPGLLAGAVAGQETPATEIVVGGADGIDRTVSVVVRPVTGRDGEALGAVAALHDVTHLRSAADEMERKALQDGLTGLPNRTLLTDRLERALARAARSGTELAVLFIDLNGFKVVNDTYGHEAGDTVLRVISRRLLHAIRPDDTVARLGGDEFVVVCEGDDVAGEATSIASRILDRVADPILLSHDEVTVGCSIGIAVADASCPTPAALLAAADEAMYDAKQHEGRDKVEVSDQRTRIASPGEVMESELHQAILRHELDLEYQPISDLSTGQVVRVEAFVRWDHPLHGRLHPADFLPIAERSGLIIPMGRALLAEACSVVGAANGADHDQPLQLHVNVSARQLLDRRLEANILAELDRSGLDPEHLCIEIREQDLAGLTTSATGAIRALDRAGVRFAVDNFGSGPASVTELRRHPISIVKIDRSHIAAMDSDGEHEAFVQAVIHLAGNLGIRVVAEGVETDEQRRRLTDLGCEMAQGYHFCRPRPAADLPSIILPA